MKLIYEKAIEHLRTNRQIQQMFKDMDKLHHEIETVMKQSEAIKKKKRS
ncbi:hypothetical protein [Paenibacillus piri]|nr:hypothetical protein [Paenibacillus piri]